MGGRCEERRLVGKGCVCSGVHAPTEDGRWWSNGVLAMDREEAGSGCKPSFERHLPSWGRCPLVGLSSENPVLVLPETSMDGSARRRSFPWRRPSRKPSCQNFSRTAGAGSL